MKVWLIRTSAIAVVACLLCFFAPLRDYVITILSFLVFVWATALLAACVVVPEEVALWFKRVFDDWREP